MSSAVALLAPHHSASSSSRRLTTDFTRGRSGYATIPYNPWSPDAYLAAFFRNVLRRTTAELAFPKIPHTAPRASHIAPNAPGIIVFIDLYHNHSADNILRTPLCEFRSEFTDTAFPCQFANLSRIPSGIALGQSTGNPSSAFKRATSFAWLSS